nr:6-hydroxymethylpterin diphosphokinase MptE-like protein [uncultured Desulfobacter sp.]
MSFVEKKDILVHFTIPPSTQKLTALRNIHQGKRAFFIGNGPSLTISDLNLLQGEISFACNKIYLAFDQTQWRPTYYMVEDGLVAQQNAGEINNLHGMTKIYTTYMKTLDIPLTNGIYYRCYFENSWPEPPSFSSDALDVLYSGNTVIYLMLQMASFMGITQFYLIGIDFSFRLPNKVEKPNGQTFSVYTHANEHNHFHPDYRAPGEKWYEPNLERQALAFKTAEQAILKKGGVLYNATRGGNLENLPRVNLDCLFT